MSNLIYIASDHAGFIAKEFLIELLHEISFEVEDLGTYSMDSCHYPEFAIKLAKKIQETDGRGILCCGSGIGVSMVANRFKGVRAALCRSAEDAKMSRLHNNSNVLCLGERMSDESQIKTILNSWLGTDFEGGRHAQRVDMFNQLGE